MAVIKREITFSFSPNLIQHLSNTAMTSLQHYCQHNDAFQRLAINVGRLNGNDSRAGRCIRSLNKMVDDMSRGSFNGTWSEALRKTVLGKEALNTYM